MVELAHLLVEACDEVMKEGTEPEFDIAVTIISGRIGFMSPADTLNSNEWHNLVETCARGGTGVVQLNPEVMN
jgi:hypothetical protein